MSLGRHFLVNLVGSTLMVMAVLSPVVNIMHHLRLAILFEFYHIC